MSENIENYWETPNYRSVGRFTDLTLYAEALLLAQEQGVVSVPMLKNDIRQRLFKMVYVEEQSESTVEGLIRELNTFQWFAPKENSTSNLHFYEITSEGRQALELSKRDSKAFLRLLAQKNARGLRNTRLVC